MQILPNTCTKQKKTQDFKFPHFMPGPLLRMHACQCKGLVLFRKETGVDLTCSISVVSRPFAITVIKKIIEILICSKLTYWSFVQSWRNRRLPSLIWKCRTPKHTNGLFFIEAFFSFSFFFLPVIVICLHFDHVLFYSMSCLSYTYLCHASTQM